MATLKEIDTHWNLLDIAEAHTALDIKEKAVEWENQEAERKAKEKSN